MQRVLVGIQKYQNFPFSRPDMPICTQWHSGEVKIVTPSAPQSGSPAILLVPSMVNKSTIFDLLPERSLVRWLNSQGINASILDWGEPARDEGQRTIDSLVATRLVPAIEAYAQGKGAPVHVLGYCMGGTLLVGAAQIAARHIQSLLFLASPWDFHAGAQELLARVRFFAPQAGPRIAEKGYLPMDWMLDLFASLRPEAAVKKFADFAAENMCADAANLFVAVEDWLNDGVDLPAETARECIEKWFLDNAPAAGGWCVNNIAVDPGQLEIPSLIIGSRQDRLVDYESAAALHARMKKSVMIDADCGHVGMIAGGKAIDNVWRPIAQWVFRHN